MAVKNSFLLPIAERFLREYFVKKIFEKDSIESYNQIQRNFLVYDNAKKFYVRLFKNEINRIIIDVVLDSLTDEKRKFVELKYKKQKQLVSISFALNVSISQLMIWNKEILEKISAFLQYRLDTKDIFQRSKIVGMINVLAQMDEIFLQIDPDCQFVRIDWLKAIRQRKKNYENLLKALDEISGSENPSLADEVILTKLKYPNELLSEIAEKCRTDRSFVSRTLNGFAEKMKKYIF